MRWPVLVLIVVACIPLSIAHAPAGTPKNYCEPASDWAVHDYGPPLSAGLDAYSTGLGAPTHADLYGEGRPSAVLGYEDGNVGGDCDPGFDLGYPCLGLDPEDPVDSVLGGVCDFNPPIADWDGHNEFAYGGAWLLVLTGAGEPSADPSQGAGSLYCFGAEGHHPSFGPVTVEDLVLDVAQTSDGLQYAIFLVAADIFDLTGTGQGCGDFQSDHSQGCLRSCGIVTLPAGLDGSYQVYVEGTQGHVRTDSAHGCEEDGTHESFETRTLDARHVGCYAIFVSNHGATELNVLITPGTNTCGGPIHSGDTRVCYWGRGRHVVFSTVDSAEYAWVQI